MILNRKGVALSENWKWYIGAIALILLLYGYYGYFVANKPAYGPAGTQAFCPFGRGADLLIGGGQGFASPLMQSGPCSYSFTALVFGLLLLILIVGSLFIKK